MSLKAQLRNLLYCPMLSWPNGRMPAEFVGLGYADRVTFIQKNTGRVTPVAWVFLRLGMSEGNMYEWEREQGTQSIRAAE